MRQPNRNPLRPFLDRLLMRSDLTADEQAAILGLPGEYVRVSARRDIVKMDEATSHACLIVSGMVGRYALTKKGARQFLAFHIPGDVPDLNGAVRPVGVGGLHALSDTTIMRLPHAAIRATAARYPAIAEAFWRDSMLDAAVLMQWIINVGRRDARTRLAHLLCEMSSRSGKDRRFVQEFDFPATQEHLGDATALTPVHVNRMMKGLSPVVTVKLGRAKIYNLPALIQLADFDGAYLTAGTGQDRQLRVPD